MPWEICFGCTNDGIRQERYISINLSPRQRGEAPYGKFLNNGGRAGNDGKRERAGAPLFSLSPSRRSPRAAISPLPRPTATFTDKATQLHERGCFCRYRSTVCVIELRINYYCESA